MTNNQEEAGASALPFEELLIAYGNLQFECGEHNDENYDGGYAELVRQSDAAERRINRRHKDVVEGLASLKRERDQLTAGLAALCECYTGVLDAGNKALKERDGLREALKSLRNNIDSGLLTALRNGGQLDMDGCEVRVSRQACEEAADHLEQLATISHKTSEEGT